MMKAAVFFEDKALYNKIKKYFSGFPLDFQVAKSSDELFTLLSNDFCLVAFIDYHIQITSHLNYSDKIYKLSPFTTTILVIPSDDLLGAVKDYKYTDFICINQDDNINFNVAEAIYHRAERINGIIDISAKIDDSKFYALVESMPDPYFVLTKINNDYVFKYANKSFYKIGDFQEIDVKGKQLKEVIGQVSPKFSEALNKVFSGTKIVEIPLVYKKKNYMISVFSNLDNYCAVLVKDITKLKRLEEARYASVNRSYKLLREKVQEHELYNTLFEQIQAAMLRINFVNRDCYFSKTFFEYLPSDNIDFSDLNYDFYISRIYSEDIEVFDNKIYKVIKNSSKSYCSAVIRLKKRDGNYYYTKINCNIFRSNTVLESVIIGIKDINNEMAYLDTIINVSNYDQLTSLYNQKGFSEEMIRILKNYPDKNFSLLYFNINRFNLYNEMFGFEKGNEILKYTARMLDNLTQDFELARLARIDADSFLIFLENTKETKKVLTRLENIYNSTNTEGEIVPSIGIYNLDKNDIDPTLIINRAKTACEIIKGNYVIRHNLFSYDVQYDLYKEQNYTSRMTNALKNEEFKVYYQPKYSLQNQSIMGAEALVRWHSQEDIISPNEFIPIFERNGFIVFLDLFVLDTTCKLLKYQIVNDKYPKPISVNISMIDLYTNNICYKIINIIDKYNLDHEYVQIELTESAYTENKDLVIAFINVMHENNIKILMDDFGSGYSSLNLLKELPVDVLKIDLKFLSDEADNFNKGREIVSHVIKMANKINIDVIAEGVETASQANFLRASGCSGAQGYLFSKALSKDNYLQLLIKEKAKVKSKAISINTINQLWKLVNVSQFILESNMVSYALYTKIDDKIKILKVNDGYSDLTGFKDVLEMDLEDLINVEDIVDIRSAFDLSRETNKVQFVDYQRKNAFGKSNWNRAKIKYVYDVDGLPYFYSVISDISSEKRQQVSLEKNYKLLLNEYSHDKKFIDSAINEYLIYCEVNLNKNEITKYQGDYLRDQFEKNIYNPIGLLKQFKKQIYESDYAKISKVINKSNLINLYNQGQTKLVVEYRMFGDNSSIIWHEMTFNLFSFINDVYTTVFLKDITEAKQKEGYLMYRAERDPLTSLYNRAIFEEIVEKKLQNGQEGTFFMIDIDDFKKINDTYGHLSGDKKLVKFSDLLKETFSIKETIISRFGGDEFAVFVPDLVNLSLIQEYISCFEKNMNYLNKDFQDNSYLSASIGVCISSENSYNDLYAKADEMLYRSKKTGKGQYSIYGHIDNEYLPTILIADDLEMHRKILAELLSNRYNIIEASDGDEVIDILKEKGNIINVAILDNVMPNRNGIDVLKYMSKDSRYCDIPVIITTLYSEPYTKVEALNNGAIFFIDKPYDAKIINVIVDNIVKLTEKYGRRD